MDKDKRRYPRRPVELDIELSYPSGQIHVVKSRDISEGGLFLVIDSASQPIIGEVLRIKLLGDSASKESLPSEEAVVVHQASDGIGVAFIEMELDEHCC